MRKSSSTQFHGGAQNSTLSVVAANQRRDEGIKTARQHADRAKARWRDEAFDGFALFLTKHGGEFLSETFVEWGRNRLPQPPDGRAWGGIIRRAANMGLIEQIGTALASTSNRSPKPLWRRTALVTL
jgi:hypothetical protein